MISLRDLLPAGVPDESDEPFWQRGAPGRFSDLLSWSDVERILNTSCFDQVVRRLPQPRA